MGVLKIGKVKELFHDAGIRRISQRTLEVLDAEITELIKTLARDVNLAYPDKLVIVDVLERVTSLSDKYVLKISGRELGEVDMRKIIEEEPLPDGFLGDDDDE